MPIRAADRARYPSDWSQISLRIKARAEHRCEWCGAVHGAPHPLTGATVVLTVAHLNHQPEDCAEANLRALCQRCHNRYDQRHRQRNAARTRRAAKRNGELFDAAEDR